jgi:SulP family sulfate permease
MIAIHEAWRAGLLKPGHWTRNLVAGLVVGLVALPLAMAFAIASGARPESGLFTAIVAGIAVSVFGGTRMQIAGPTGAFVVILSAITARYGFGGLQVATLMAGVMLMAFGIARLGNVIRFIPDPVIAGFTAGIALIIFVGQWSYFLGLPAPGGTHFHDHLIGLIRTLPQLHPATALLGLCSLALLVVTPRVPGLRRLPAPLVALVCATIGQALLQLPGVATLGSAFGEMPRGLPALAWPDLNAGQVVELIGPAFTIAMLGAIESLLSAVVADGMAGTRHDPNQELVGQGIANILSPLFGGFAATGAIARTATNVRSGATGPLGGIVHAVVLAAILVLAAPLASRIPLCALAAILFVVAWNMSELRHCLRMARRAPRADVVILSITFLLTVFSDLVIAVNIGVLLAMLQFLRRMSESVVVTRHDAEELERELGAESGSPARLTVPESVLVYGIDGPFFFGAAETLERALASTNRDPRCLIVRLARVPFMDMTGLQALEEAIGNLQRRHVRVLLCEGNDRVHKKLADAGLLQMLGPGNYHRDLADALEDCKGAARSGRA